MHSYHSLIVLFLTLVFECYHCLELKGVTIESPPFVVRVNDSHFEGYAIDLLNELSRIANFNYVLYPTPDGKYGAPLKSGMPTGMIQELFMRRADFAIADLVKSEIRERYIDFSEPFMQLDLTALINKKNIANITSFEDLLNQTNITYGVLREGSTHRFMNVASEKVIQDMGRFIFTNDYNLVNSRQEGIERALNTQYAFIQESVANEYAVDQYCELTVIDDKRVIYPREYAIGLQRNSLYKQDIDKAIRQLRADGTLARLKAKYWRTKCLSESKKWEINPIPVIRELISITNYWKNLYYSYFK